MLTLDARDLPGLPRQAFKKRSATRPPDPRDAALGEAIVLGVVRNLRLLDHLLGEYAERPVMQIDGRSRLILLVALHQLRFLDRVPESAVVNEAARQARTLNTPRSVAFVNAVLRAAVRRPDVDLPPESDPAAHAEIVLSHPPACFARYRDLMGAADALACCRLNNVEPPTLLRLAAGRSVDDLRAAAPGVEFAPHEEAGIVVVGGGKQADYARIAELGLGQVQDATSARTVTHHQWTGRVLDRCCGVGTKTRQLLELPGVHVTATDASGKRVRTLRRALGERDDLEAHRLEWLADSPLAGRRFDGVLIDAPCSNSGVIRRRPEARYRQDEAHLADVTDLQRRILDDTLPAVAAGGTLVWATCSVWPEENRRIVDHALAAGLELTEERLTLPDLAGDPAGHHDGGYVALLRRP